MSSFKRSTSHVDDNAARPTATEISWWASAASLDTAHLGSSYRIDDKTYQLLTEVDEDEDKQGKVKGDNDSNTNCNGTG
jgi:hypothetical protein